ncbi:hypothetical protein ACWD1Z_33670 [Streptomyces sp. NPDC002784]
MDGWSLNSALGLVALRAEEGEGEVDALDLTDQAFGLSLRPSLQEVCFELGEPSEHPGIDVEHRAADAGVFVLAGGAVGASAGAELA